MLLKVALHLYAVSLKFSGRSRQNSIPNLCVFWQRIGNLINLAPHSIRFEDQEETIALVSDAQVQSLSKRVILMPSRYTESFGTDLDRDLVGDGCKRGS